MAKKWFVVCPEGHQTYSCFVRRSIDGTWVVVISCDGCDAELALEPAQVGIDIAHRNDDFGDDDGGLVEVVNLEFYLKEKFGVTLETLADVEVI
jgi:hypothetical protein